MPPSPWRHSTVSPSPAQTAEMLPTVSVRRRRNLSRPGPVDPLVAARKPTPRCRFRRMRRRRAPNARIPSRRSVATRRHVAASACSTASGSTSSAASLSRTPDPSTSASHEAPPVNSSRMRARPAGTSITPGSKRPASVPNSSGSGSRVGGGCRHRQTDITLQIPELQWAWVIAGLRTYTLPKRAIFRRDLDKLDRGVNHAPP